MVSFLISFFAGLTLSGAFAPLDLWFFLPLSISLLLYAVTKTTKPFLISFIFACTFNFFTLKWSGTYVGLFPVLALVILQSSFYLPLGFISYRRNRYSRIWLALPILMTADALRSLLPFGGFGWNRLSFSQANSPFRHAAFFLGDSVLAFLGISLGIALYLFFARAQLLSVALIIFITTLSVLIPIPSKSIGSISVLAVQGNVPRLGLDFNAQAQEVFNYHLKQSETSLRKIQPKPDVIIWPENSVDVDPFQNPEVEKKIAELAKQQDRPVIVGAVLRGKSGSENVSLMFDEKGKVVSKYTKRVLTPFGEYIPFRTLSTHLSKYVNQVTDFVPGKSIVLHKIGEAYIAPILCYEIIDDQAVRSIAGAGNVMLIQTNNATFADSSQSIQQLNISRIRAIENNRWLVSISTTGVSAVVDNLGNIQQMTKQNTASYLSAQVPLIESKSPANKYGQYFHFLIILLSFFVYLGKIRKHE